MRDVVLWMDNGRLVPADNNIAWDDERGEKKEAKRVREKFP